MPRELPAEEAKAEEGDIEAAAEDLGAGSGNVGAEARDLLPRVARQGGGGPAPAGGGTASEPLPDLDPERFNDFGYRQVIRRLGLSIIDAEGPVTFGYLATRVARAHGFKRTGGQIRRKVE